MIQKLLTRALAPLAMAAFLTAPMIAHAENAPSTKKDRNTSSAQKKSDNKKGGKLAPVVLTVPPGNAQLMLIRDALTAFNQANLTSNYSVISALGSPNFRIGNPPERLAQLFTVYRANKVNLSPILYLNPILARPGWLENGQLKLVGSFPSSPMIVKFDLTFEPSDGQWKLFAISVALSPAQPTPPAQR